MQKKTKVNMNIDRPRLQRLALRKVQQEKPKVMLCVKCGQDSFLFDFRRTVTVKTCKNNQCRAVDIVSHV